MDSDEWYCAALHQLRMCRWPVGIRRYRGLQTSIINVLPAVLQYLVPARREFPWWLLPRFTAHGMRDVVGIIGSYLRCAAVAFGFDDEDRMWILWRRVADGALAVGLRGARWDECRGVAAPPGCIHYELIIDLDCPHVKFFTESSEQISGFDIALPDHAEYVTVGGTCREFYVAIHSKKLWVTAHGVVLIIPDGVVGVRPRGATVYGLLPSGELVKCREATKRLNAI